MPAQLPPPIITGQQRRSPDVLQQLLVSLLGQVGGGLIDRAFQQSAPPTPQQASVQGSERAAASELRRGRTPEARQQTAAGMDLAALGDARTSTSDAARDIEAFEHEAPARLQAATEATAAREAEEAWAAARETLSADPENGEQLAKIWDFIGQAQQSGIEGGAVTQLIGPQLPATEKQKLDLQIARTNLAVAQSEQEADAFATGWLQQQGIVPPDAPTIPGAGATLLNVIEGREGEAINWTQEGVDFILGRIGETQAGTGGGLVPGQPATIQDLVGSDAAAVPVEQAIAEWRSFVEQFAPPEAREREIARIESAGFQRLLTKNLAIQEVVEVLRSDPSVDPDLIRESLSGGFPPKEINEIIGAARRRANPATVR